MYAVRHNCVRCLLIFVEHQCVVRYSLELDCHLPRDMIAKIPALAAVAFDAVGAAGSPVIPAGRLGSLS